MFISTRGRYGLRVMCDLLPNGGEEYMPLKEISARQEISQKYLESIMKTLVQGSYVEASSGKGGGYRLSRPGDHYKVGDILRVMEGSLAPVTCVDGSTQPCGRREQCYVFPLWEELMDVIEEYLNSITLEELVERARMRAIKGNEVEVQA